MTVLPPRFCGRSQPYAFVYLAPSTALTHNNEWIQAISPRGYGSPSDIVSPKISRWSHDSIGPSLPSARIQTTNIRQATEVPQLTHTTSTNSNTSISIILLPIVILVYIVCIMLIASYVAQSAAQTMCSREQNASAAAKPLANSGEHVSTQLLPCLVGASRLGAETTK